MANQTGRLNINLFYKAILGAISAAITYYILTEVGDALLTETGDHLIQENG